jgi:Ca2+-binding EF-hand superfamily protein
MTRKKLLAVTALAATLIASASFADSHHGHKGQPGGNDRAGMMMQGGGQGMMGNMGDMSDMMGMMHRMHGNMMGDDMMGGGMMQMFDADGDGTVTPDELRTQLQAKLTENDADGNGSLSIAEFETLHSAMIREMMVDRFQQLDADGDGAVTSEEMTAPADKMDRIQKMRAGQGMMQGQPGDSQTMGEGTMMNGN